jgi:hypothetical protein
LHDVLHGHLYVVTTHQPPPGARQRTQALAVHTATVVPHQSMSRHRVPGLRPTRMASAVSRRLMLSSLSVRMYPRTNS